MVARAAEELTVVGIHARSAKVTGYSVRYWVGVGCCPAVRVIRRREFWAVIRDKCLIKRGLVQIL